VIQYFANDVADPFAALPVENNLRVDALMRYCEKLLGLTVTM